MWIAMMGMAMAGRPELPIQDFDPELQLGWAELEPARSAHRWSLASSAVFVVIGGSALALTPVAFGPHSSAPPFLGVAVVGGFTGGWLVTAVASANTVARLRSHDVKISAVPLATMAVGGLVFATALAPYGAILVAPGLGLLTLAPFVQIAANAVALGTRRREPLAVAYLPIRGGGGLALAARW